MTNEQKIGAIIERLNNMEEGEKKEKIKEMIKSKLKEGGDVVTANTTAGAKSVITTTKAGAGASVVQDLKNKGIGSAKVEKYQ